MKKIFCILSVIFVMLLSSCYSSCYEDFYYDSLEEYTEKIAKHNNGFSVYELDHPDYFLPSKTFINDYPYLEGVYYFDEEDPMKRKHNNPSTSLLCLKYTEEVYMQAKQEMLDSIPMYGEDLYLYDDFVFYRNANFVNSFEGVPTPTLSKWFTMAGYNDEENILIFIGFYAYYDIKNKYQDSMKEDWVHFIDEYYGKYYDFSRKES